jgi:hypothetical protein
MEKCSYVECLPGGQADTVEEHTGHYPKYICSTSPSSVHCHHSNIKKGDKTVKKKDTDY